MPEMPPVIISAKPIVKDGLRDFRVLPTVNTFGGPPTAEMTIEKPVDR